jgi:hypothetical protein
MPLNEKAALGGAANLETSSQGSLDNPPYKPSPTNSASHIRARPGARRRCRVAGDRRVVYTFPRRRSPRLGRSPHLWTRARSAWRAMQASRGDSALSSWARALGGNVNGHPVRPPGTPARPVAIRDAGAIGGRQVPRSFIRPTIRLFVRLCPRKARRQAPRRKARRTPPRKPAAGAHQALARHDSAAPIKSATVAPDNGAKASWLWAQHEPISESGQAGIKNVSNYKLLRGQTE